MSWLLRHNFWMVKLLGLVVVMAFVANTATTLAALYLMSGKTTERSDLQDDDDDDDDETNSSRPAYAVDDRARRAERTAERILGHSAFCPTCGPTPPPPEGPGGPGGPEGGQSHDKGGDLSGARRSQLPLVVAATMEHMDPALSVATLVDTQHGVGGLFGVGDVVGGRIEIVHVATGVVHISNNGILEYIPFEGLPEAPPPASKPTGTPTGTPTKPAAKSNAIPGAEEAIQCTDKGDCVVDRAFVEKLIAQPKLLMGQGRVAPATAADGSPGFKLRGVRKGTLPQLLGLKSGDIITEVGGSPLTMEVAVGLYSKLRHASHVEVTVDRRGERMRRQLDIRS